MPSFPYSRQTITEADIAAVNAVLRSSHLTQGPAVEVFEARFAERHAVAHAVAVCNATAALHIACLALGAGPGTRVWTSPVSFVASANCALYCGAEIDFVDIDPITRLMSIEALQAKLDEAERAGELPVIVIPVDLTGLPCDYAPMRELADRYGFKILSDSSHAVGATYRNRPVGAEHTDASVFSFHAVKIVTTGEGGMITTQDPALAARLASLRSHGITRDPAQMTVPAPGGWYYEQLELGYNYRMTDIQAALGNSQLARLDQLFAAREAAAERYDVALAGSAWRLPSRLPDRRSAWHLYVIERADGDRAPRDCAFAALREAGYGVNLHYIPIHLQPFYASLGFRPGQFPAAEAYYNRALTIPLFPDLTAEMQQPIIDLLWAY